MKQITKAQEILDIILPIPKEKSIVGKLSNGLKGVKEKCCVLGHVNKAVCGYALSFTCAFDTHNLTARYFLEKHGINNLNAASVNNSPNILHYNEPEIKDRVVHFFTDMVRDGY